MVSHVGVLLEADQLQVLGAITPTEPEAPEAGTEPEEDWRS